MGQDAVRLRDGALHPTPRGAPTRRQEDYCRPAEQPVLLHEAVDDEASASADARRGRHPFDHVAAMPRRRSVGAGGLGGDVTVALLRS